MSMSLSLRTVATDISQDGNEGAIGLRGGGWENKKREL